MTCYAQTLVVSSLISNDSRSSRNVSKDQCLWIYWVERRKKKIRLCVCVLVLREKGRAVSLGKMLRWRHMFLCRGHNRGEEGLYWKGSRGGGRVRLETKERRQRTLRKFLDKALRVLNLEEDRAEPLPFPR